MNMKGRAMAENSKIEWTDHTWSPWEGCTKISPACDHCYAARMNGWLKAGDNWGPGAPRLEYGDDHWDKPVKWQRNAAKFHTLHGRRQRVFPSVCDPFDNEVHQIRRERFWGLVRLTPGLDWLVLTKRIGNAKNMLPADWGDGYPNVWLGSTVVTQDEYDRDIGKLLRTPARVHFLSIEPMLEPIDMRMGGASMPDYSEHRPLAPLDWVICGGESGPRARPIHATWVRSVRDQCAAAGVHFLWKQWGDWRPVIPGEGAIGAQTKWPDGTVSIRVGKKLAGRLLDGVEHNGFPA